MTLTQVLAIWFIVSVAVSPLIGKWLANRRMRAELEFLLERERRIRRLARKLQIADRIIENQDGPFMLDMPDEAA